MESEAPYWGGRARRCRSRPVMRGLAGRTTSGIGACAMSPIMSAIASYPAGACPIWHLESGRSIRDVSPPIGRRASATPWYWPRPSSTRAALMGRATGPRGGKSSGGRADLAGMAGNGKSISSPKRSGCASCGDRPGMGWRPISRPPNWWVRPRRALISTGSPSKGQRASLRR